MFHFPGCPPTRLCIHLVVTGHYPSRVPPFGNLRIKAYLQLPEAYRSLSRPSSAISAMASTLRSYSLDLAKLLSDPPKTIERSNKSNSFHCCCFDSFLCSFQGAIEVFVLSSFDLSPKLQNDTETIFEETFRFHLRLSPAICRSSSGFASFLKPFIFRSFQIVPTLEVEQSLRSLVSP